jgi:hypothetical protein
LETKHDKRTAPKSKLFVSKRRLQKQKSQPRVTLPGSIPGEDVFCSSETKHDRRTAQKNRIVCFGEEITGTKVTNPKTNPGLSLGEDGFRDNSI